MDTQPTLAPALPVAARSAEPVLTAELAHHLPQPSFWPILLAAGIGGILFFAFLIYSGVSLAGLLIAAAAVYTVVCAAGWANTIAVERRKKDRVQTNTDLTRGFMFFLASEAMIFESYFEYLYFTRFTHSQWPPAGMPRLETSLPAIATLILVSSSFTLNWSIGAFLKEKTSAAKNWLLLTIGMGIFFLGMQGFEWGMLNGEFGFHYATSAYTSTYFLMTGFHGCHVTVGLILLSLVYWRMERGDYSKDYHMSMKAAEYYWHFVDVIWVLLFFSLYLF
ncbi:MAG: cytochrome c oxidase subunit 3 [Terriglobales bacterium]